MVRARMTQYHRLKRKRLSDLLVDEKLATKEVVIAAMHEQKNKGGLLSSLLLALTELDVFDLARVLVEQYQIPFVDLERYTVHKDLIEEFPADLLHRARVVPLERFGPHVSFACQEVPSPEMHDALKEHVRGSVLIFAAFARDITVVLSEHAPHESPTTTRPVEAMEPVLDAEDAATHKDWQSLFDSANEAVISDLDEPA